LPAGKATPAPRLAPARSAWLEHHGFLQQFNAKTAKEPDGMIFPVLVTVYTTAALRLF